MDAPMAANMARRIALVGKPNAGKTALFNALTGSRQKVANYAGVTVERRSGYLKNGDGDVVEIVDLPGAYGLDPRSLDEEITRKAILGALENEPQPDLILCVLDATNLKGHLPFALELRGLGVPVAFALNMMDMAKRDGLEIDPAILERELGAPVIPTIATRRSGLQALSARLPDLVQAAVPMPHQQGAAADALHKEARRIAKAATMREGAGHRLTRRLDTVVLHPILGPVLLAAIMFVMFQAVYTWAAAPMEWIDAGAVATQQFAARILPDNMLESLVVDGVIAGVGSVVIFLPQILILFGLIIALEQSGYLPRAAFLLDKLMARLGLSGAAFIPLLSSFACAVPGIMAARTIEDQKDRLTTILVAPLMTCSARLPVYALIIAAFIPSATVGGVLNLQGLVMFGLYLAGIVSAMVMAFAFKRTATRGSRLPLLSELPKYQRPLLRDVLLGLQHRAFIFLKRAGTIILVSAIVLWALLSLPPEAAAADVRNSVAGWVGRGLEVVFAPIGFTWEMAISLIPGMAAREVVVGALGTIYAVSADQGEAGLAATLLRAWSLPTALSFLAWYVFAPQCLSTFAAAKRETNSWLWPLFMFGYLFVLAYAFAGITYWLARASL